MDTDPQKTQHISQHIVDAAYALFIEQGYNGTSMRQIAERAGIALGGIYNHFESKEDIFVAVILAHHPYNQILPAFHDVEGKTVGEMMRAAILATEDAMRGREDVLKLMFTELVEFENKHVGLLLDSFLPKIYSFMQHIAEIDQGTKHVPPALLLRTFISLVLGYFISELMAGDVITPQFSNFSLSEVAEVVLNGVLVEGQPNEES